MITKSLNKAAYITYITDHIGDVIEDKNGMYVFQSKDTEEIKRIAKEYDKCVSLGEELYVDLIEYNKIIFNYKSLVKAYKEKKEREERLDRIDRLCDKVLNNLGKL